MSTQKKDALTGKVLGKYELGPLLGKGAFGEVYLAHALENREWVRAVKVLAVGQREYENAKQRFKLEASLCRDRIHPNVILVHEPPQEEGGYLYLVMEYADGGSLRDLITKAQQEGKPIAVEEVRRIAIQLVAGLKAIHEHPAKLVHRDICPENILLKGRNKQVLISDLGVAQTRNDFTRRTELGSLAPPHPGHPAYMSPQQRNDRAPVKPSDDLFSVGCVLFELLTLKPYQGAEVELDPHPGKYRKEVPRWLDEVVARCLAPERRDRFQVADDLLVSLQQGRVIRRTAEEVLRSRPISPQSSPPMRPVVEPPKREAAVGKARRRKGWLALVGLLLLLVSVVAGGVAMGALGWGRLQGAPVTSSLTSSLPSTFTRAPSLAMTRTLVPALTPTSTPALTTTPTFTPVFTSAPFAEPVQMGTPYPVPDAPITATNAEQIVQLARWGKGPINNAALSPDEKLLAVASSFGVYLYDAQTFGEKVFLETDTWVTGVAFSPDGTLLAAADNGGTVRLWRTSDNSLVRELKGGQWLTSVTFSPDGQYLAVGAKDYMVRLWRISDGVLLRTLEAKMNVTSVAFSPDGELIAAGGGDANFVGAVRLWRVANGTLLYVLRYQSTVSSVAFSPDGKTLVAASTGPHSAVRMWRVSDGRLLNAIEGQWLEVESVAFSPNGELLALGAITFQGGTVEIRRAADGALLHTFNGGTVLAFPKNGRLFVSEGGGLIRLRDIDTGDVVGTLQDHTLWVNSVDFSPDGSYVVVGEGGEAQLRQVSDGKLIFNFQENMPVPRGVSAVSFSPNGQLLAIGHWGDSGGADFTLWEVSSTVYTQRYSRKAHLWEVNDVAFSPDSAWLASAGGDEVVRIWNVKTGKVIEELKGHTLAVTSVAFSPDGKLLASAANDGTVRLWRAAGGRLLRTQHHKPPDQGGGVHCVAFSPDGQFLASGGGDLRLWRVSDGLLLHVFEEGANSVSFSPDGSLLAAASGDEIDLWDLINYRRVTVLKGHTGEVMDVTFSPDGTLLASGSEDGTIRLWGVKP